MNQIDQRLIERYGTLSVLGTGGMGTVYRAYDAERGIQVAIKRVDAQAPLLMTRLRREAQALSLLAHPHVCPLLEWVEEDGAAWIVMPVLSGDTLDKAAADLSPAQLAALLIQACEGVEAAHAQGLVHRDLKPSNIMVCETEDGSPKAVVMDFGIARIDTDATTLTGTHEVLGTPAYMAPEQARGEAASADVRADVWGLGATLYFALTGAPPFGQGSLAQVMARVLDDDVVSPRVHQPAIPEDLARICLKALERSLTRRYQSVSEMRRDLQRFLSGTKVQAPNPGPGFYLRRMLVRHPRFWASLGVLVLALLTVVGWAIWTNYRSAERAAAARELAGLSERVRAGMRAAKLAPAHDLNRDREPLLADIRVLQQRYGDAESAIRIDLDRALADAYQALGRAALARPHAERLLAAAEPTPADRLRLANIALEQHLQALPAAMNLPAADRELALETLRRTHLQPAIAALGALELPPALGVRLALAESDWAAAEAALARYRSADAGDHQGPFLAAELAYGRAAEQMLTGDLNAAKQGFERADRDYRKALQIARSEPTVLARLCQLSAQRAQLRSVLGKQAPVAELDPSCSQLRLVDPTAAQTDQTIAAAWYALASAEDRRNQPVAAKALLSSAIAVAQAAVEKAPDSVAGRLQLARALSLDAALTADDYAAAIAGYDHAIEQLRAAQHSEPNNLQVLVDLGATLRNRGKRVSNQGSPEQVALGLADYQQARKMLEQAVMLRPEAMQPRRSLSLTLMFSFYAQRSEQAQATQLAEAAIAALDPLLEAYPEHPDLLFDQAANLGDYWQYLASIRPAEELPQTLPVLDRSLALFARLRRVAPARPDGYEFELGFRAQAGETLRIAGSSGRTYLDPIPELVSAAEQVGLHLAEQYLGWALTEHALALAASEEASREAVDSAFASAQSVLDRGLADPQRRYESVRMLLQWSGARAQQLTPDDPRRAAVLERAEALFAETAASERGQFDNILWCEGAMVAYQDRHRDRNQALATALRRLDHCAELGPVYFQRWQATRDKIAAEQESLD